MPSMYMLHLLTGVCMNTYEKHTDECTHLLSLAPVLSGAALKVPTSAPRLLSVADLGLQPIAYSGGGGERAREGERASHLENPSFCNEVFNATCCP